MNETKMSVRERKKFARYFQIKTEIYVKHKNKREKWYENKPDEE